MHEIVRVELVEISKDVSQVIEFLRMGIIKKNLETEMITYLENLNKRLDNLCISSLDNKIIGGV